MKRRSEALRAIAPAIAEAVVMALDPLTKGCRVVVSLLSVLADDERPYAPRRY